MQLVLAKQEVDLFCVKLLISCIQLESFTVFEFQQLLQLLCPDFPIEVTEQAGEIVGFGRGVFSCTPTLNKSGNFYRETGLGNERIESGEFIRCLRIYFGYIGKKILSTILHFANTSCTLTFL